MNVGWRERNQQDAANLMLITKLYLNMFRASLCPSSGEQECALPHTVFCIGSVVCGCVELGRVPAPHNHSHHNQCRTPYAAVHTLVLLMMGIMLPETCWDKSLLINIRLVASCWFLSLHHIFKPCYMSVLFLVLSQCQILEGTVKNEKLLYFLKEVIASWIKYFLQKRYKLHC